MISPWFFNVCMDDVVQVVNVKMVGKGLDGRFEIHQLLFADDTGEVC